MNQQANNCIGCVVKNCQFHHQNEDYCTLSHIEVTTHEANPTKVECTDCGSFKVKGAND